MSCLPYLSIVFQLLSTCVVQQAKCEIKTLIKERYLDFLDILTTARDEDGRGLSHQEIRDEVDTFLFAGSWCLVSYLVSHVVNLTPFCFVMDIT